MNPPQGKADDNSLAKAANDVTKAMKDLVETASRGKANSELEAIVLEVMGWIADDIPLDTTEIHMINDAEWKKLYARMSKVCQQEYRRGQKRILKKLARTYTRVIPPIKESPMELSFEAEQYNRFQADLMKFIEIEEKRLAGLEQVGDDE